MKLHQKGFGTVEILVAILVIGIVGALGFLITTKEHETKTDKTVAISEKVQTKDNQNESIHQSELEEDSKVEVIGDKVGSEESKYDYSYEKGTVKIELQSKRVKVGSKVQYRLSGLTYSLEDNLQIFFVDAKGNARSLSAFSISGIREDSVVIPLQVFNCSIGGDCSDEAETVSGMGKLVITHSNSFVEDISIDIETE